MSAEKKRYANGQRISEAYGAAPYSYKPLTHHARTFKRLSHIDRIVLGLKQRTRMLRFNDWTAIKDLSSDDLSSDDLKKQLINFPIIKDFKSDDMLDVVSFSWSMNYFPKDKPMIEAYNPNMTDQEYRDHLMGKWDIGE